MVIIVEVVFKDQSSVEVLKVSPDQRLVWWSWPRAESKAFLQGFSLVKLVSEMLITVCPIRFLIDLPGGSIPGWLFKASCLIWANRSVTESDMID